MLWRTPEKPSESIPPPRISQKNTRNSLTNSPGYPSILAAIPESSPDHAMDNFSDRSRENPPKATAISERASSHGIANSSSSISIFSGLLEVDWNFLSRWTSWPRPAGSCKVPVTAPSTPFASLPPNENADRAIRGMTSYFRRASLLLRCEIPYARSRASPNLFKHTSSFEPVKISERDCT